MVTPKEEPKEEPKPNGISDTKESKKLERTPSKRDPTGDDDWKHKAPYKTHEDPKRFKVFHEGSCHCGKVKYQVSRETPLESTFCHCNQCQGLHGSAFQWAALLYKKDINFINGPRNLVWYNLAERKNIHKLPCRVSCAYCKAPILDEAHEGIFLFPTLINFSSKKARANWAPSCHMYYSQRIVDIPDGKPKLEQLNGDNRMEMPKEIW